VISPNGIGVSAYWDATRGGISGIDTITTFDPEPLSCRIAGAVKSFRPEDYLLPNELKRTGRAIPLAIAAAKEALQAAKVDSEQMGLEERRSWGVVLGSGGGTPAFTEEQYRLYFNDQLRVSAYNVSSTMGTICEISPDSISGRVI
jgi:3-oxoacyl-(acyl-carrier-protein) synthase